MLDHRGVAGHTLVEGRLRPRFGLTDFGVRRLLLACGPTLERLELPGATSITGRAFRRHRHYNYEDFRVR